MKTTGCFLFALFCLTRVAEAQHEISYDSTTDIHQFSVAGQMYDYRTNIRSNSSGTVGIKGSPFLFQQWQPSSVNNDSGSGVRLLLNYNITEDYVVVSMGSVEKIVYPASFVINGQTFSRLKNRYYEVLHFGKKIKLMRRYSARLKKAERSGGDRNPKHDYEYVKSENLFLQDRNGTIIPVKLQERSFLSLLPDSKAARQIVEKNNLNLKTEKDVLILLAKLDY